MVPHEFVGILRCGRVIILDGRVFIVAPRVGMNSRPLRVRLLKDRIQVDHGTTNARQIGTVVHCVPTILNHEFRAWGHAVTRIMCEQVGEVVPRYRTRYVRAVILIVPFGIADTTIAFLRIQEVDREDFALVRIGGPHVPKPDDTTACNVPLCK